MRARWLVAAFVVGVAAVVSAGCGAPSVSTAGCQSTPDALLENIGRRLQTEGELRNGRMLQGNSGLEFITAELHRPDEDDDEKGDLLTWARGEDLGTAFVAVDEHAREDSSWPEADFDVRKDGVVASRSCADEVRGETGDDDQVDCPPGTPQSLCDRARG